MGSSKTISNREVFYMVLLFQQSGVFWLLPYLMVRENGTAGLAAIAAGIITAVLIIGTGHYWRKHMPERGFITALKQRNVIAGSIAGSAFLVIYLLFAILMLYSLIDVIEKQLLTETPHIVLCATVAVLAGYMAKGGIESIARMSLLCIGAFVLMLAVSVAGTMDLFALEHALPLQIQNPQQMQEAIMHSIFCYSGLLVLFMLYPAVGKKTPLTRTVLGAISVGAVLLTGWSVYALCIFGEYSLQTILWIPVHLARMVQISSFLEQTESLFIVLWMIPVLNSGSLLVWSCSEGLQQLLGQSTSRSVHNHLRHWGVVLIIWLGLIFLQNSMRMLWLEYLMAQSMLIVLPIMLLLVLWLAPERRKPS